MIRPTDYIVYYWDQIPYEWQVGIEWVVIAYIVLRVAAWFFGRGGYITVSDFKRFGSTLADSFETDYQELRGYAYEQADDVRDDLESRISEMEESVVNIEPDGLTKVERIDRDFEQGRGGI